jgi:hypothetical protein
MGVLVRIGLLVGLCALAVGFPSPAWAGGVGLGGACRVTSQCAGSLQCVRGVCGCTNNSQCSSKVAPGRPWCKNGMCQK